MFIYLVLREERPMETGKIPLQECVPFYCFFFFFAVWARQAQERRLIKIDNLIGNKTRYLWLANFK